MDDFSDTHTSDGGLSSYSSEEKLSFFQKLSLVVVIFLALGLFVAVFGAQQRAEQRSRAAYHDATMSARAIASTGDNSSAKVLGFCIPVIGCHSRPDPTSPPPPTPTSIPSPTSLPVATLVPTAVPTSVPTSQPTAIPTAVIVPTETPIPGATLLGLKLTLRGIGTGGNPSPLHPQRSVTIEVYNVQNQLVMTEEGSLEYDASSGTFVGEIDLGTSIQAGAYTVKTKVPQYLRASLPGIQMLAQGQTNSSPQISLIAGDVNGDNQMSIVDYNILMGCYSDLLPAVDCTGENDSLADLTDDGKVNQIDYNFFLREFNNRTGE